jgi:hypothetical protein
MLQKQHVKTLSTATKFDFFAHALDGNENQCIGFAKSQHRGCLKQVARFRWTAAISEAIQVAEDDSLDPESFDEVAVDLAPRLSCYLHFAQPGSPIALVKAMKLYRKTFTIDSPIAQHHQPDFSLEDAVFVDAQHDRETYLDTPGPSKSATCEPGRDAALEAALERIAVLEARLEANPNTSNNSNTNTNISKAAAHGRTSVLEQDYPPVDPIVQAVDEQLTSLKAHFEGEFNRLSCVLRDNYARDIRKLADAARPAQKIVPKKEKNVPVNQDVVTDLLEKLALLLQQR